MKKRMRRLVAVLLATAMVVQQGSTLGVSAVETEPVTEASAITAAETQASESETKAEAQISENETKAPETKASESETKAPETKASESETKAPETKASESETKAPETKASESETKAPEIKSSESETKAETQVSESETKAPETQASESETKAETQTSESGTKETELKPQTDETATESESDPAAAEKTTESETATEQATETEQVSETVTETEFSTEEETTAKAEAELEAEVTQEVFQQTTEDAVVPMVKYTVKLTNKTADVDAEGVSLKVVLDGSLSYKKQDGESLQLVNFDTLANAANAAALGNVVLSEEQKAVYADGSVVVWNDQTVAGGTEKEFVFFAEVKDGETDVNALRNLWFVNNEAVKDEQIKWVNAELLEVKKELPSEFVCEGEDGMVVTAVVSDPNAFPEGTVLVAEPIEVTEEDIEAMQAELDENKVLLDVVQYDVRFECDGQEIEPADGVTVEVNFVREKTQGKIKESDNAELQIQHIMDSGEVECLQADEATVLENGEIQEASFVTESFSPFVLMSLGDKAPIKITLDAAGVDESGALYIVLTNLQAAGQDYGNGKRIIKKIEIKDGKIDPEIIIDKLYGADNDYPMSGEKYAVKLYESTTELKEDDSTDGLQNVAGCFEVKQGSYVLQSCEVKSLPETIELTDSDNEIKIELKQKGVNPGSYSAVENLLGIANDFGVFTMKYKQDVHTEATIVADEIDGTIGSGFNLSKNNYNIVNYTIKITKTYTEDGLPYSGQKVKINLYRDGMKYPVASAEGTTDDSGKCTFTFGNGNSGQRLAGGTYHFYEVIGDTEIEKSGTVTIGEEKVHVSYDGNEDLNIDSNGYYNYSYFNKISADEDFHTAEKGSYIVLGDTAWTTYYSKVEAAGGKTANVTIGNLNNVRILDENTIRVGASESEAELIYIVKAGTNGFATINIASFFGESGTLWNASRAISCMKSAGATVYYISAADLQARKEKLSFNANGSDNYIIVNVDMSNAGESYEYPGKYKINGHTVDAQFDTSNEARILWNFFDYKNNKPYGGKLVQGGTTTGVVLAPNSDVSGANGNLGGTMIAKSYVHDQGEIHQKQPYTESKTATGEVTNAIGDVESSVSTKFRGIKDVDNGTYGDAATKAGYSFKVELGKMVEGSWQAVSNENIIIADNGVFTSGRNGAFATPNITFKPDVSSGKYYFKVAEMQVSDTENMEYDTNWYLVAVTIANTDKNPEITHVSVQLNGVGSEKGLESRGLSYTLTEEATFTNTRALGKLSVEKKIAGATVLATGDTYTVKVTADAGTSVNWTKVKEKNWGKGIKALEAVSDGITFEIQANETVELTDLPYGSYTVTETDTEGKSYVATYTVGETNTNKVTVTKDSNNKVTITNTYKSTVDVTFKGTKYITGIDSTEKKFTFELYKTQSDFKLEGLKPIQSESTTGTIAKSQAYQFDKLTYDAAGTYYYVVKEKALDKGSEDGFAVDATVYHITVVVKDTNGVLEATKTVTGAEGATAEKLDFTNTYTAKSANVVFSGTKSIEGVDSTDAAFTFELYESDDQFSIAGKTPIETVSTTAPLDGSQKYSFSEIEYKKAGTHHYVVKEKALDKANGFTIDATIYHATVEVVDDGKGQLTAKTTVDGATASTLNFTNRAASTPFALEATKTMAAPGAKLGTYEFEVTDETGKVLATAKNDETGKVTFGDIAIYKLDDIGKTFTYTVKEKIPQTADGTIYDKTVYTVTVTVSADATTGAPAAKAEYKKGAEAAAAIEFVNDVTHLSILKVDESGTALAGAKLVLKDAAGNLVDSWTTDGKSHDITGLAKGSYTLSEIEAPEGYRVSKDIPVEITDAAGSAAPLTVTMTDTTIPKSDKRSLTVTKRLRLDGVTSDVGIKDAVYYVALFSDEAKTQRVSDVKPVVFKNSTASSVTFENLAKGTYYVGETDENGTLLVSKMVNDKVIFYPEYDTTAKVEFEGSRSETASAEFTNVYVELTSGLYLSGQLTVTKKVLLNGVEGTSDETYYARVFFDKAMTSPASDVLALNLAGGTSASVTVTDLYIGETIGSSATYYVAETDKDGTPLDPDAVTEFEISIDKSEIVMDANNSAQEVVITNSYTEEETETETETEVDEKKTAPKTGDDTDFMRYLLLMALSAGTCAAAFDRKRRRARRVER